MSAIPKRHLDQFSRFAKFTAESPYILESAAPSPLKIALCPWGDLELHVTHHSIGPSEPTTQMSFRSVQSFFAQITANCPYTSQRAAPSPFKIALSRGGILNPI